MKNRIGMIEFEQINDSLSTIYNALKENNEMRLVQKMDRAIALIYEVETSSICHCLVPDALIPLSENICVKCGKKLQLKYGNK